MHTRTHLHGRVAASGGSRANGCWRLLTPPPTAADAAAAGTTAAGTSAAAAGASATAVLAAGRGGSSGPPRDQTSPLRLSLAGPIRRSANTARCAADSLRAARDGS